MGVSWRVEAPAKNADPAHKPLAILCQLLDSKENQRETSRCQKMADLRGAPVRGCLRLPSCAVRPRHCSVHCDTQERSLGRVFFSAQSFFENSANGRERWQGEVRPRRT